MQLMVVATDKAFFAETLNRILDRQGFPKGAGRVTEFHNQVKDLWPPDRLSYETVRKWLGGESIPRTSRIPALADFLGVRPYELMDRCDSKRNGTATDEVAFTTIGPNGAPVEPGDDRFEYVPSFRVAAAAGNGREVYTEEPNGTRAYSKEWLRQEGLNARHLVMIEVDGDSMWPTICDGDSILVDTSQTAVIDDEIYVFRVDHDLRVKRLRKNLNGTITITSDNKGDPSYIEERVTPAELAEMNIVGQVVHRSGRVGRRR